MKLKDKKLNKINLSKAIVRVNANFIAEHRVIDIRIVHHLILNIRLMVKCFHSK